MKIFFVENTFTILLELFGLFITIYHKNYGVQQLVPHHGIINQLGDANAILGLRICVFVFVVGSGINCCDLRDASLQVSEEVIELLRNMANDASHGTFSDPKSSKNGPIFIEKF